MKTLKWNRSDAGQYVTPDKTWLIKGKGVHWKLYHGSSMVFESSSKKECQKEAQKMENSEPEEPVQKSPPRRPGKPSPPPAAKGSVAAAVLDICTAVNTGKGTESLDDALRSLYLQLSQTTSMIGILGAHAIEIEKELKEITKFLRKYK